MARAVEEWIGRTPDTPAPPRVQLRIWDREGGVCYLSGRKIAPGEPYQLEHVIALINGGENRESNLRLALTEKHKIKTKADLAEKSKVAAIAKKHIGAVAIKPKIPSPPAVSTAREPRIGKTPLLRRAMYR